MACLSPLRRVVPTTGFQSCSPTVSARVDTPGRAPPNRWRIAVGGPSPSTRAAMATAIGWRTGATNWRSSSMICWPWHFRWMRRRCWSALRWAACWVSSLRAKRVPIHFVRWCWWTSPRDGKPPASNACSVSCARIRRGFASLDEAAEEVAAYLPQRRRRKDRYELAQLLRRGADGRLRWHWDPAMLDTVAREGERHQQRDRKS